MDSLPMNPPVALLDELDLTNVEANRPLIKDGTTVEVKFCELKVVPQKNKPDARNAEITFLTQTVAASNLPEKEIAPGFKHVEVVSLATTDKYDPRQRLAQLQLCFLGRQGQWKTDEMIGKTGLVRFGVDKDEGFGERNRIRAFNPKKDGSQTLG